MGRVKSLAIKRTTRRLLEDYGDKFSKDFNKNQEIVIKILETEKKSVNKIAGYITREVKKREKKSSR